MKPELPACGSPGGCLIGLDLGTSAIKGVLTDTRGAVLAEASVEVRVEQPRAGWVEVAPEPHYDKVCGLLRELAAAAPGEVLALAMAAASGNTLLTDGAGVPLIHIINWMDQRAQQDPPAWLVGLGSAHVAQITGWPCVDSFPLAHLAWLRAHKARRYQRAAHVGMDTDWLLHRLTGHWMMDTSTATTFHLVDQVSGTYHEPFLRLLELPEAKLSALRPSGTAVGPLTARAQRDTGLFDGTTVVTGCFDHPAAARAAGVSQPGQLLLSCGTSWVGFTPCLDRRQVLASGMLCDPFLTAHGGPWGGMFALTSIGRTIDWYLEHVIAPGEPDRTRIFNEAAAQARPGADGLTIDLRAAPGPVAGSRANISRAVMEGAARLLNEKILALRDRGFQYDKAVMVGGPANSPIWPTIVQELTGISITTGGRSAGARGAAVLAGIGCGVYRDGREGWDLTGGTYDG